MFDKVPHECQTTVDSPLLRLHFVDIASREEPLQAKVDWIMATAKFLKALGQPGSGPLGDLGVGGDL